MVYKMVRCDECTIDILNRIAHHENIVRLKGVCFVYAKPDRPGRFHLITEYAPEGMHIKN